VNMQMTPMALVRNYGSNAQTNFAVACSVFGAGSVLRYHAEQSISLVAGDTVTVNFGNWTPTNIETCLVKMSTGLAGDEKLSNNIKTQVTDVLNYLDASVTAITRPHVSKQGEIKRVGFTPQVTVSNNGSYTEDVPVIAEIYSLSDKATEKTMPTNQTFDIDPMTTDIIGDIKTITRNTENSRSIDYTVLWAIPIHHVAAVGLTSVCIGDYPAGDTLLWVASAGATGSSGPNWILIYNLNTRTLVDSFLQANTTLWGYRDMCFYDGYVYAGTEATLHKIDPITRTVVGTHSVTGISGGVIRALTDNNVQDSLFTANWNSPIYKFYHEGGAVRSAGANDRSVYGLAYDPRGYVWGSTQSNNGYDLTQYSYPDFTVIDSTMIPELGTGIAGGCEMWGSKLLYLNQGTPDEVLCIAFPEPIYRDSVAVNVGAGKASAEAFFKPCTLWADGDYLFTSYTQLAGDMNSGNNTMSGSFSVTTPAMTLVSPEDGSTIANTKPTYVWNTVAGAGMYEIEVDVNPDFTAPVFSGTLSETEIESDELWDGDFFWRVRVESPGGADPWSDVWSFTIATVAPGWAQKEDVPEADDIKPGKFVKDGGSLVAVGTEVYAFPGNKSARFYKYGEFGWDTTLTKIPLGLKYKPGVPLDSLKWNKKNIGKGAALCYDGGNYIYATKGNGTFEFWAYDISANTWIPKAHLPTIKAPEVGTSIAFLDGSVFMLAGGVKLGEQFFFRYFPDTDTWITLTPPNVGAKPWKAGSAITAFGNKIYAMKGGEKPNYFTSYDPSVGWAGEPEFMTEFDSVWGGAEWKLKKVYLKDGAALTGGGVALYAMKGGGSFNFFSYTPETGWVQLQSDTIPRITPPGKKSVPKTGAAMAYAPGRIYMMKGNKLDEFWVYGISAKGMVRPTPSTITATMTENTLTAFNFAINVMPNPITRTAIINYSLPVTGKAMLKLYNASGRLVQTLLDNTMTAGTYSMNLNATKLAKGVYFLKYEANHEKSEIKLIIQ